MPRHKILIVANGLRIKKTLKKVLDSSYKVSTANNYLESKAKISHFRPDVILLDLVFLSGNYLDVLAWLTTKKPTISVIVLAGKDDKRTALKAIRLGATNYLTKPVDRLSLLLAVEQALKTNELKHQNVVLRDQLNRDYHVSQILGNSEVAKKLREDIVAAAKTENDLLLVGQEGIKKEWVARSIHCHSSGSVFTRIDCRSFVLGATIFHGTVFLDQVHTLAKAAQKIILRASKNARIIAATTKNLKFLAKKLDKKLTQRISGDIIEVSSLKYRTEDIPLLVFHYFQKHRAKVAPDCQGFSQEAITAMQDSCWPGNLKQLESTVLKAMVLNPDSMIGKFDLQRASVVLQPLQMGRKRGNTNTEEEILRAMDKNGWYILRAARTLGVHRNTVANKLAKMGINHGEIMRRRRLVFRA